MNTAWFKEALPQSLTEITNGDGGEAPKCHSPKQV